MSLLDRLRAVDTTTVSALAADLGVSRRTVLRDLATLRERGTPVNGETGPGGGVRLLGDRGITAVHLSLVEVVALWLAARLSQGASQLPWNAAAATGLAKLLASLPERRARELRALCRRVIVGPPASEAVKRSAAKAPPELLVTFERAFSTHVAMAFGYTDREGRTSARRVEPHGLLVETPVWYVMARDLDKGEPRLFRMDRIARPRLLHDTRFTPNLDLVLRDLPDRERYRPLTSR